MRHKRCIYFCDQNFHPRPLSPGSLSKKFGVDGWVVIVVGVVVVGVVVVGVVVVGVVVVGVVVVGVASIDDVTAAASKF